MSDVQQTQKRNSYLSDSKSPTKPPLPILLIVSCSAAWVISQLSYNSLPQLLEPIKVAFDRSDEVVTRMYGYELFVFAIVALVAAGPLAPFLAGSSRFIWGSGSSGSRYHVGAD